MITGNINDKTPISLLPLTMRDKVGIFIWIHCLVKIFEEEVSNGMIQVKGALKTPDLNFDTRSISYIGQEQAEKREVNGFFGYAISRVLGKYKNQTIQEDVDDTHNKTVLYIKSMRILHHQALLDDEYMKNCYALTDQIRNQGGLALVSSTYFPFGHQLLNKIRKHLNSKDFKEKKNQVYKDAKKHIFEDNELRNLFMNLNDSEYSILGDKVRLDIYEQLVMKTFNAKYGAQLEHFNDQNTSRYAKVGADMTLRGTLKVITNNNDVKAASGMNQKIAQDKQIKRVTTSEKSELIHGHTQVQLEEIFRNEMNIDTFN